MKTLILIILLIIAMLCLISVGLERHERAECLKWQAEKERFEDVGWYPTFWQREQCQQYNIDL